MKKVMVVFGAMIFASFIFYSCGGGKSEYEVKPSTTAIKGDLSDFFEVVDGTYKIEIKEYKGKFDGIKLKVQIKKKDTDFNISPEPEISLICEFLDDGKSPIGSKLEVTNYGGDLDELMNLKTNETTWVEFYINEIGIEESEVDKIKTFNLNSILKIPDAAVNEPEQKSDDNSSVSDDSSNCDQFIIDYEEFVVSYIKILKKYKAKPTDTSILNEYTDLAQKATEMQTEASNCTDPKYVTKLLELNNKLAKAAL
jgi:hypothetical protein